MNRMIVFPAIWWLFPVVSLGLILFSLYLTKPDRLESRWLRNTIVASGAFLGFLALALPIFQQPHFHSPIVSYAIGLPLTSVGLIGRIYPMIYLRRKGTTTAMDEVGKLVDTGPYAWVRHPQYTFGFILLVGWYLVWGAVYSLCLMPFIGGIIYSQALIEERYVLEKKFGREYAEYRKRVGMLIPRIGKWQPNQGRAGQSDGL
jgi:protein-S-isoprenylcysteine O-methyltransferase Ste14